MSAPLDVVVVGGANWDFLVQGQTLPVPGSTINGERFQEAPGGKGANQAVAVARLGASVAFIGCVGDDERGRTMLDRLGAEGVNVEQVSVVADLTGVALVMVDKQGTKQILTAPGANRRLTPQHITRAQGLIMRARVVLLQLEVPLEATEAAIQLARTAGARVVLDPAPPHPLPPELLRSVDVIRPNEAEAEALTGIVIEDQGSARRAGMELRARGAGAAVVGAPGGNLLIWSDGELWLPHLKVNVVDTTGAGDAFAGAIAASLAGGAELPEAVRFASAAAAAKATKLGAQAGLPTREAVMRLL